MLRMSEELYQRRRAMRDHLNELEIEEDAEDVFETFDRVVDEDAHQVNVARLNQLQQQVYDNVITAFNNNQVIRQIVLGTAGVGKSALIDAIADELTLRYTTPATRATQPAVAIAAPTGLAAINIRGSTLHSLFGIQVQKGRNMNFNELRMQKLNQLREYFKSCKLLIIDEVSMCSNVLLTMVSIKNVSLLKTFQILAHNLKL